MNRDKYPLPVTAPINQTREPMKTQTTQPDTTYNGWTNYETWAINVNMDTPEIQYWQSRARELNDDYDLGQELKEQYEMNNPLEGPDVYSDLLNGALTSVNWRELAARIMDDVTQ